MLKSIAVSILLGACVGQPSQPPADATDPALDASATDAHVPTCTACDLAGNDTAAQECLLMYEACANVDTESHPIICEPGAVPGPLDFLATDEQGNTVNCRCNEGC